MTFAKPTYLFFLFLIPFFGLFLFAVNKSQTKALKRLGEASLIKKLTENINWRGRKWRTALWFVSVFLLIFSLARPQWGSEVREIEQEGLQVMVALDVSQSMMTQDIKPDRLTRAKLEIADLMHRLNGDEIGLVLFSGASFIQVPLTSDYNTALTYLDSAQPGVISRPGTVIGDAIRTAMQGFDPDLSSQKVLVVMTDGEDHETNPLAVAQEIADQDVLIYTIGFGTPEGEPVPVTDTNGNIVDWKRDQAGNVIVSMLDEETLKSMAEVGNGNYYRAAADGRELDSLLAEIDKLQRAQLQNRFEVKYIERFQYFLGLSLLALLVAEMIPDRRLSLKKVNRIQTVFRNPFRKSETAIQTNPSN